jgi:hypothetical protein
MNLSQAIKEAALRGERVYLALCTVDRVDETARTVDCTGADGVEMLSVRLQAGLDGESGAVLFPKAGSEIVVGFLDRNSAAVLLCSEVEKIHLTTGEIVINGGRLGGLVNIGALTDSINALVDAFNSHTHTIPAAGINTAGSATNQSNLAPVTVPAVSSGATRLVRSDYEDTKIKH